jgi:hypothetical protein
VICGVDRVTAEKQGNSKYCSSALSKLAEAVPPLSSFWEAPGSNYGRDICYSECFCGYLQFLQMNLEMTL